MALGSLQEALAEHAARTQRDLRLQNVIAGTQRIALGAEEYEDAFTLVIVQVVPSEGDGRCGGHDRGAGISHSRTPARKNIDTAPINSKSAVPRSGWRNTSTTGTITINVGTTSLRAWATSSWAMPWK